MDRSFVKELPAWFVSVIWLIEGLPIVLFLPAPYSALYIVWGSIGIFAYVFLYHTLLKKDCPCSNQSQKVSIGTAYLMFGLFSGIHLMGSIVSSVLFIIWDYPFELILVLLKIIFLYLIYQIWLYPRVITSIKQKQKFRD